MLPQPISATSATALHQTTVATGKRRTKTAGVKTSENVTSRMVLSVVVVCLKSEVLYYFMPIAVYQTLRCRLGTAFIGTSVPTTAAQRLKRYRHNKIQLIINNTV